MSDASFVNDLKPEPRSSRDIWRYEDAQTRAGVEAVRAWAGAGAGGADLLAGHDLLISGDVDEILSAEALHHLRHCQLVRPVISGAIIVPFGNINKAFRSTKTYIFITSITPYLNDIDLILTEVVLHSKVPPQVGPAGVC